MPDPETTGSAWLTRYTPREWIQVALAEHRRATSAFESNDLGAGIAGCKRAAGMALNGALLVEPDASWGRSYVEHVRAVAKQPGVPAAVRDACHVVLEARAPSANLLILRLPRSNDKVLEASRDIMAHALAVVLRHEPG